MKTYFFYILISSKIQKLINGMTMKKGKSDFPSLKNLENLAL